MFLYGLLRKKSIKNEMKINQKSNNDES